MSRYSEKELLASVQNIIKDYCEYDFFVEDFPNILGQGAFKTVFSLPEYPDIVFKIGISSDSEYYSSDGDREISSQESCENEVVLSALAEEEGLNCFAHTDYIGEVTLSSGHEYPIYIQDRVDIIGNCSDSYSEEEDNYKKERKIMDYLVKQSCRPKGKYSLCLEFLNWNRRILAFLLIRKYGIEEFLKINNFIEKYKITDLHSENWGFKDNQLIIFDFGFTI